jgi:hypothetical protein
LFKGTDGKCFIGGEDWAAKAGVVMGVNIGVRIGVKDWWIIERLFSLFWFVFSMSIYDETASILSA